MSYLGRASTSEAFERDWLWLTNPQRFKPAASMQFDGVADPSERDSLTEILERPKNNPSLILATIDRIVTSSNISSPPSRSRPCHLRKDFHSAGMQREAPFSEITGG